MCRARARARAAARRTCRARAAGGRAGRRRRTVGVARVAQRLEQVASAASGERPGRTTSASHGSPEPLSAGTTPARTNDDLPTPDGPTIADQRLLAEARDRRRDVLRAPEEPVRVRLLERGQAGVRALVAGERCARRAPAANGSRSAQQLGARWRSAAPCAWRGSARRPRRAASGMPGDVVGERRHRLVERGRGRRSVGPGVTGSSGCSPGEHLEQDDADRPQVAAVVDGVDAELLGRHVRQRADDRAGAGLVEIAVGDRDRRVAAPRSSGRLANSFAMPKSSTFTVPACVTMMLSGLRSRWTMPASCARVSARSTGTTSSAVRASGIRLSAMQPARASCPRRTRAPCTACPRTRRPRRR